MSEPNFAKTEGEKFKHEITGEFGGISLIWTLSHLSCDVGGMWMSTTFNVCKKRILAFKKHFSVAICFLQSTTSFLLFKVFYIKRFLGT